MDDSFDRNLLYAGRKDKHRFSAWDYVVFSAMLAVSAGIGLYYALTGGHQKTKKEFLLGNRQMNMFPVAMSLIASFISAITLLGTPSEVYVYGTQYCAIGFCYFLLVPMSAHLFIPIYYHLDLTSAYEYLSFRFGKLVRTASALTFVVHMVIYMAIVLYAPSLALQAVTGLNLWISIVAISVVCTFYTAIGGMKAVLWTDTFQIMIMMAGIFATLIKGSIDLDGFENVWDISNNGSRLGEAVVFDFNPNPLVRHTFWSLAIGGTFTWGAIYAVNQAQVQRALSCKSLRQAQGAYYIAMVGLFVFMILSGLVGLVIYAYYSLCDPVINKDIGKNDQLYPLFVMETMKHMPGLPGLFCSGIFSGALSTVSSGLNSLAAVTWVDLIRPFCLKGVSDRASTLATKAIAVVFGALCMFFVFLVAVLGELVLQAALALFGIIGGPVLGVFVLGIFLPWTNEAGAFVGLIISLIFCFWIGIGQVIVKPYKPRLPTSIENCEFTGGHFINKTMMNVSSVIQKTTPQFGYSKTSDYTEQSLFFYRISYMWYSLLGVFIVILIGLIVSFITGRNKPGQIDPRTLSPYCFWNKEFMKAGFNDEPYEKYEVRAGAIMAIDEEEGHEGGGFEADMIRRKSHHVEHMGMGELSIDRKSHEYKEDEKNVELLDYKNDVKC